MNEYQLIWNDTIAEDNTGVLLFSIGPSALPCFNEILQRGFFLINPVGISIEEFLTKQLGLSREYIGHTISTIFLDGKIVHDIGSTIIRRGSVLALSSALPGFVGAALRSRSIDRSFSKSSTSREINASDSRERGIFCVKLFNLPMRELGPSFLRRGILLRSTIIEEFLETKPDALWEDCRKILLDGEEIDRVSLEIKNLSGTCEWLRLSIHLPEELCSEKSDTLSENKDFA
jgi:hypothetical protein